ncbi:transposase IS4 family protein, partial [mine drainage metagenome]
MKISEIRYKIPEVFAYARIISKRYGHTRKYAKHIVALVIKQLLKLTDRELTEFMSTNEIGRLLDYKTHFTFTIFSKVRSRASRIVKELYETIVYSKMKERRIRLIAQDSTDIFAFSSNDKCAKYGHRTPSKREQRVLVDKSKTLFFGYKLHVIADAETDIPIAVEIAPANRHDKTFFHRLYGIVKGTFHVHRDLNAKFLGDAGYDATDIYQELHHDNVKP